MGRGSKGGCRAGGRGAKCTAQGTPPGLWPPPAAPSLREAGVSFPDRAGSHCAGSTHVSGGHSFRQEAPRVLRRHPPGGSRQHPAPLPGAAGAAGLSWHGEKSGSYCAGAPLQRERRAQFISFKETQPEGIIRASLRTQSHIVYPTQIKKRGPQEHGAGEIKKRSAPRRVSLLPRRTGPLKPLCVSGQRQESRDLRSTSGLQRNTRGAVNKYGVENGVNLCTSIHLPPVLLCLSLHAFGSGAHTSHVKALLETRNRGGPCSGGSEGQASGVVCACPPALRQAGAEGPRRGGRLSQHQQVSGSFDGPRRRGGRRRGSGERPWSPVCGAPGAGATARLEQVSLHHCAAGRLNGEKMPSGVSLERGFTSNGGL